MRLPGPRACAVLDGVFRFVLGGVFVYAAVSKLQDPALFAASVAGYQILPGLFVNLFALLLPAMELVAGLALLATKWTRESALILLGMLGVFFVGLVQALVRGLDISCGCFGEGAGGAGSLVSALVRDLLLFVPAVWLVLRPNRWLLPKRGVALAAGLAVGVMIAALGWSSADSAPAVRSAASAEESDEPVREEVVLAAVSTNAHVLISQATNVVLSVPQQAQVDAVVPGGWAKSFPAALARARAERLPLLMVASSKNCDYCRRLLEVCEGDFFRTWAVTSGVVMVRTRVGVPNAPSWQKEMLDFMQVFNTVGLTSYPNVAVYWPRAEGGELGAFFIGRRHLMPGPPHASLAGEFVGSLELILADYFKARPAHLTLKALYAKTAKQVKIAKEGQGTVRMNPVNGMVKDGGSVTLTAKPSKGWTLMGWMGPDGKPVKFAPLQSRAKLKVTYGMTAGTYTAIFRRKTSAK